MGGVAVTGARRDGPAIDIEERVLFGAEAVAWLDTPDNSVWGKATAKVDARIATEYHGWGLAVHPASNAAEREQDDRDRATAVAAGDHLWTPPAWRRGERCSAIVCPACGHRLAPNQRMRRIRHDSKHLLDKPTTRE